MCLVLVVSYLPRGLIIDICMGKTHQVSQSVHLLAHHKLLRSIKIKIKVVEHRCVLYVGYIFLHCCIEAADPNKTLCQAYICWV